MKGNYNSLTDLAAEIDSQNQESRKNDMLVATGNLMMEDDKVMSVIGMEKSYPINELAHQQLSGKLGIPKKYYDQMLDVPGLRTENVNAWLHQAKKNEDKKFLVRTLDNNVRAFLSDRFKPIDNILIMNAFLPSLKGKEVQIQSSSLTDKRLYLQVTFPGIEAEVCKGDVVRAGIILTNSEVGCGAVDVSTVIWRLVCSNGLIGKTILHKYHAGRRCGGEIEDYNIYRDDTIIAELNAFKKRLRDNIAHAMSESFFHTQVAQMKKLAGIEIANPIPTVENVTKRYGFTDNEKDSIIMNLGKEEKTRWGVVNSVTALAHEFESPDRQYEVEKIGSDILYLSESQWQEIEKE